VDGATIVNIPSRGLPNGLCMTYQDINHVVVMSMRFEKVRVGARQEVLIQYIPHIVTEVNHKENI
jgi:hypothetical protein